MHWCRDMVWMHGFLGSQPWLCVTTERVCMAHGCVFICGQEGCCAALHLHALQKACHLCAGAGRRSHAWPLSAQSVGRHHAPYRQWVPLLCGLAKFKGPSWAEARLRLSAYPLRSCRCGQYRTPTESITGSRHAQPLWLHPLHAFSGCRCLFHAFLSCWMVG